MFTLRLAAHVAGLVVCTVGLFVTIADAQQIRVCANSICATGVPCVATGVTPFQPGGQFANGCGSVPQPQTGPVPNCPQGAECGQCAGGSGVARICVLLQNQNCRSGGQVNCGRQATGGACSGTYHPNPVRNAAGAWVYLCACQTETTSETPCVGMTC